MVVSTRITPAGESEHSVTAKRRAWGRRRSWRHTTVTKTEPPTDRRRTEEGVVVYLAPLRTITTRRNIEAAL